MSVTSEAIFVISKERFVIAKIRYVTNMIYYIPIEKYLAFIDEIKLICHVSLLLRVKNAIEKRYFTPPP